MSANVLDSSPTPCKLQRMNTSLLHDNRTDRFDKTDKLSFPLPYHGYFAPWHYHNFYINPSDGSSSALKSRSFGGTTENAVRIQIYTAICTYCLVEIVQHNMQLDRSTYEVLQILSISLTDKNHLRDLFDKTKFQIFQRTIWTKWAKYI